jgi:hypothetical protein
VTTTPFVGNGHWGQSQQEGEQRYDQERLAAIHRAEPSFLSDLGGGFVANASTPFRLERRPPA